VRLLVTKPTLYALPTLGPDKAIYKLLQGRGHADKDFSDKNRITPGTPDAFQRLGIKTTVQLIDGPHNRSRNLERARASNVAAYIAPVALA
jgi:hypothetical protein